MNISHEGNETQKYLLYVFFEKVEGTNFSKFAYKKIPNFENALCVGKEELINYLKTLSKPIEKK